jgi:hypothetical protein
MDGKSCARLLVIAGFTRIHAAIDTGSPDRTRWVGHEGTPIVQQGGCQRS